VIRPLKFAKYLSRLGVKVTVLTVDPSADAKRDASLLTDVPTDVQIIRVREQAAMPPLANGPLRRLRVAQRWAIHQCLVPDDRAGFISPAVRAACDPGRSRFDVVLATGKPWSAFVAAERIADGLNLPLALDYRDPWTTPFSGRRIGAGLMALWRNPRLERRILSRARAIVSVHESVPAMMETGLGVPGLAARCRWIPNGYDPEDFEGLTRSPSSRFVLSYVGSLYRTRTLRSIADALGGLVRAGEVKADDLVFRVLGPSAAQVMKDLQGSPIADRVEAPGLVPHREALSALVNSTVNLLVDIIYDGPNVHTPGKLYEYLRAGRPILSISRDGTTPGLIREARAGWVVPPGDTHALAEILKRAYQDWRLGGELPVPDQAVVARFDRSRLAAELQEVLAGCTSNMAQGFSAVKR
jgi:glycosyltransferase involved in cell wall biosynthesis